jgi:fatty-acid desaturase
MMLDEPVVIRSHITPGITTIVTWLLNGLYLCIYLRKKPHQNYQNSTWKFHLELKQGTSKTQGNQDDEEEHKYMHHSGTKTSKENLLFYANLLKIIIDQSKYFENHFIRFLKPLYLYFYNSSQQAYRFGNEPTKARAFGNSLLNFPQ